MKATGNLIKLVLVLALLASVVGCAAYPPPGSYRAKEIRNEGPPPEPLTVGVQDRTYVISVADRTPFGIRQFPMAEETLYNKGYDMVRKQRKADFAVDVSLTATAHDNPDVRGANMLGGALLGAATGAIIGGAVGDPGAGAAIGAASGGVLGAVAPADTPMVRIDLQVQSFNERLIGHRTRVVDLTGVPPHDVHRVIDTEVSRMLDVLPRR